MSKFFVQALVSFIVGFRAVYANTACGVSPASDYIFGGEPTKFLELPWHVSITYRTTAPYFVGCGASLISNQWILTAAHCSYSKDQYYIATGDDDVAKPNKFRKFHKVVKIVRHPKKVDGSLDYDVALMKFEDPLDFNGAEKFLAPVCLPERGQDFSNMNCVVTGYGKTEHGSGTDKLLKVTLKAFNQTVCRDRFGHPNLTPRMFCAGDDKQEGKGACFGDSGGPLQCKVRGRYVVAGITSFLNWKCGTGAQAFARVSAVVNWIKETVAAN